MTDQPTTLTARQLRAVEALVEGRSYAEAADAAEVSPRRLYEWRQHPAFRAAVDAGLAELQTRVRGRMAGLADLAVDRLRRVLDRGDDGAAVRAALGVLDRAGHGKPERPLSVVVEPVSPFAHLSDEELDREIKRLEQLEAEDRRGPE